MLFQPMLDNGMAMKSLQFFLITQVLFLGWSSSPCKKCQGNDAFIQGTLCLYHALPHGDMAGGPPACWSSYWTFQCTKVIGSLCGDPERVVAQNSSLPQWCYYAFRFLWLVNTRPSVHSESKALNLQTCNWDPRHHYEKSYEKYLMLLLYIYFFKKSRLLISLANHSSILS